LRHYIEIRRRLGRVSAGRSRQRDEAPRKLAVSFKNARNHRAAGFAHAVALRYDRAAIHVRASEIRNVENQSR
jgi:hypothetical protein